MDNLENKKLNTATKTKLGSIQLKNTANINTVDNQKITKVLTASAKVVVENITPLNAEVKFDGVVEYDLLVVLENNEIVPLTQKSNFTHNFASTSVTPDSLIVICSNILECNNTSSDNAITYSSVINFDIFEIKTNSDLEVCNVPENVFTKESEVTYNTLMGKVSYEANINFELAKDSNVNKILYVSNSAHLKSVIPATDYFVASGEVVSFIVYQGEDNLIKSCTKCTSFTEEIEFKGINKDTNIQARVTTKETTIVENLEKNVFVFDVPIKILAQFFTKNGLNCAVDAYSLTNEVKLTTTSFQDSEFFSTHLAEENILTNFTLTDNMQPIDKILSITPINISLANQIVKDGEILLEGLATINIIYYFEDDENNNILNSLDVEVPFSLSISTPEIKESDSVTSTITLGEVNIKNKRGKELEILAEAKINYDFTRENISALTTQIVVGEEKLPKDYALEIYLSKEGQSLWDIAKELNISTTDLVSQNANLSLPLKAGEKIISYNGRQENFED